MKLTMMNSFIDIIESIVTFEEQVNRKQPTTEAILNFLRKNDQYSTSQTKSKWYFWKCFESFT